MANIYDMAVTLPQPFKVENFNPTGKMIQKSETKQFLIKDKLVKWCEETSAHGFANLPRNKHVIFKVIWLLMIMTAIIYSIIITTTFIQDYYKFSTKTAFTKKYEANIEFPAVTFCNLNPFDIDHDNRGFMNRNLNRILMQNEYDIRLGPKFDISLINVTTAKDILTLFKTYASANKDDQFGNIESLGYILQKMLISCSFNNQECTYDDFEWSRDHEYGNCFSFNTNIQNPLTTNHFGPKSGLALELFTGLIDDGTDFSIQSGAIIQIHGRKMRPYLKRGIFVSTGFNTNVGISRVSFQRLGKPFSECRKNLTTLPTDSIYYKITNRGFQYTHDICKEVYTQINFYMAECGCMNPELLFTNKTNICQEPKSISCMINVTKSLNSLAINIKDCPQECDELVYEARLDKSTFPTAYYSKVLLNEGKIIDELFGDVANTPSPQMIEKNILKVNIFYKDNVLTEVIDSPIITSEMLAGLIGGQFGLFLGASFVSFIELIETILSIIFLVFKLKKRAKVQVAKE